MKALAAATMLGLLALTPFAVVEGRDSRFAWPRFVMFYGGVLEDRRAFLLDHQDVVALTASFRRAPRGAGGDLEARRHIQVAMYWNNHLWEPYVASADLRNELPLPSVPWTLPSPSVEDPARWVEPARFYPATGDEPAVFEYLSELRPGVHAIGDAGLELLRKHGVPVSVGTAIALR